MRWQWLVQQVLGGIRRVPEANARIVPSAGAAEGQCRLGVTRECIRDLRTSKTPMLVCRGAVPTAVCEQASERLEEIARSSQQEGRSSSGGAATRFALWYLSADPRSPPSDYMKLGYTKTDVFREEGFRMAAGHAASARYLQRASETIRLLDEVVFAPHRCPITQVSEELSALPGVNWQLERCPATGKPFLPCVVRRMAAGGRRAAGNLHMDTVVPGRTLSVNVYLRVPEGEGAGGEVVLYPVEKGALSRALNAHFFTTIEVQSFFPNHTYYTDELLASKSIEPIVYRPAVGDIVFLDPAYPHAVRDFQSTAGLARISLQTFVQVSQQNAEHVFEYAV